MDKPGDQQRNEQRSGFWYALAAYGMWGLFPLYWPLLEPAGAVEILAHRMVWSLAAVLLTLLVLRRWSWLAELVRQPKRLALIATAAAVVSVNWGLYIWGVNTDRVVEASLGYFINPLVSIAFGVIILHERLRPGQWAAVGIGGVAVLVLTVGYGRFPWLALGLAFSFAIYGLVKKKVALGGIESLAAETAFQFLPALAYLLLLAAAGDGTFGTRSAGHSSLLALSGLVTAIPLVCFGLAAVRIPLTMIGMLQYLCPAIQFIIGTAVFHEPMPAERWTGFALVWLALTVLTGDALRAAGRDRAALRAAAAATTRTNGADASNPMANPCRTD